MSKVVKITILMENDAMRTPSDLGQLLIRTATRIGGPLPVGTEMKLMDTNGNTVGKLVVEELPHEGFSWSGF